MELELAGKTVVVTGGASNIGRGIVLAFAGEGANVVIADIDETQGWKTAEADGELGVRTLVVNTDVTKPEQCEAMVKKTLDEFGRIDVLVNNAGVGPEVQETFREQTREGAQKVMELNFFGMFNCTKAVIEHMIAQNSGKIVNISSAAAFGGPAMLPIYGAAKAAVVSLTKSQAREFARYGIHVNSIAPGLVLPPSDEYVGEKSAHANPTVSRTDRDSERMTGGAALRRMGHPSEIGKMAVILASDAASYVTGETICVDGGSVK